MDDETREAVELILHMCKDITDVPAIYPTDTNESNLRSIKKIAEQLLAVK